MNNTEVMQARRSRRRTGAFVWLVVWVLILFFGSFFLLKPLLQRDNSPVAVTQRFIGFVELKEFNQAHQLMTPAFQNVPGWHGMLYSLYTSIDPSEAGYHVVNKQGDIAQVQFSNESGGYLYLKNVNGKWLIASPSEVPQQAQSSASGIPGTSSSSGNSTSNTTGQ